MRIEFAREDAPWILLVVDDQWTVIRNMISGPVDPYRLRLGEGLGTQCADRDRVLSWWNGLAKKPEESAVRFLALIPWVFAHEPSIRSIVMAQFPDALTAEFVRSLRVSAVGGRVAALMDVFLREEPKFVETWEVLDAAEVPSYARAMLTRGGTSDANLPDWTLTLPRISKVDSNDLGPDTVRARLIDWWKQVLGAISPEPFRTETDFRQPFAKQLLHRPSTLADSNFGDRESLLKKLYLSDPYGVWRWAGELAGEHIVSDRAKRRWLCAKAFATTLGASTRMPVTALVGLLGGISTLRFPQPKFDVEGEQLLNGLQGEDLDGLKNLGVIQLPGTMQQFAEILRAWLLHPEQFGKQRAMASGVRLIADMPNQRLAIEVRYSRPLPDAVLHGPPSDAAEPPRLGSARRAFQATIDQAATSQWHADSKTLSLGFCYAK